LVGKKDKNNKKERDLTLYIFFSSLHFLLFISTCDI